MNASPSFLTILALAGITTALSDPLPQPKTAEIKAGNVSATYADGHTETLTKTGNCQDTHVTAGGIVGWVHFSSLDRRGYALDEVLHLRFLNGSVKPFPTTSRNRAKS